MSTFVLTLTAIAIIMTAMAVGTIFSGRALKGSCGGVGDDCACAEAAIDAGEEFKPGVSCENSLPPAN